MLMQAGRKIQGRLLIVLDDGRRPVINRDLLREVYGITRQRHPGFGIGAHAHVEATASGVHQQLQWFRPGADKRGGVRRSD